MHPTTRAAAALLGTLAALAQPAAARAQAPDAALTQGLRWRMIGPHRGGRTVAATGVPGRPGTYYIGANNGGVWRSTDYGRVWTPIFDDQPTGSIGAIAIAPSNPDVVYVGSGEGLQRPDLSTGDGIYRSADGGRTWAHLGLRDGQQIPALAVDPTNPDRVFAAVLGHPYGPNAERGVFRSTDGGRTWQKVLYRDESTGAFDVVLDPRDPNTVYAVLWAGRQAPWEIGGSFLAEGSGLYKSTDGGTTWRPLTRGLPDWAHGHLGRIGMVIAPSDPRRLYALVDASQGGGVYRSDDAGESWTQIQTDERLWSRGSDFAELRVDPRNADVVYDANVVTWKSTDGGKTWAAWRGAPGGDDYHRLWIDPADPRVVLLASDQGAVVTVNGGQTWSSWYNQPTAQFYHVSTDNAFPYRVCGGQQESGSACVSSRGDYGRLDLRDWIPVGAEEYGYAVPDPLDPDIVYGGKISRFDRRTKQVQDVTPQALRSPGYRVVRTQPIAFSPADPHALYFASNVVWKTLDGGQHWAQVSPDLTRPHPGVPAVMGVFAAEDPEHGSHRGVVYALAPSPRDANRIWAGTDDGLVQVTSDGGASWRDVTPAGLTPWAKVSILDASHFDTATAYAAVNTFRLDDLRPHVWRTHDGGRTWKEIVAGLPAGAIVNVVREDPVRPGLLYAGTETAVFWSMDDGEHWQPLRLNMPATSIRDLQVKDADLVAATHGRSFWILDDVTPLRQADARATAAAGLFRPAAAWRVRWNLNTDTPIPPDEPAGQNPPEGAAIDYWLRAPARGPVTLEIVDGQGRTVRRYASTDSVRPVRDEGNVPAYWIRPPQVLSTAPGAHRFYWDLRYETPAAPEFAFPIAAVEHDTPREPRGVWALPGTYTARLTVDGHTYTQPLTVRMDPRVTAAPAVLQQQHALGMALAEGMRKAAAALGDVGAFRERVKGARASAPAGAGADALAAADSAAAGLQGGGEGIARIQGQLAGLYDTVQGVDAQPTAQAVAAIEDRLHALDAALARWERVRTSVAVPAARP